MPMQRFASLVVRSLNFGKIDLAFVEKITGRSENWSLHCTKEEEEATDVSEGCEVKESEKSERRESFPSSWQI